MIKAYPGNTNDCQVTYHLNKTGQPYFVVYYKGGACIRTSAKDVGRVFGIAKFTPGVNAIRDWCKEVNGEQMVPAQTPVTATDHGDLTAQNA